MRQLAQLRADMDALQRDNLPSQRQAIFTEMVVAKVADCANALFDPAVLALKNYVFVEGETAASLGDKEASVSRLLMQWRSS